MKKKSKSLKLEERYILEDDEDALLAIMKNDKELLLDVINELSV